MTKCNQLTPLAFKGLIKSPTCIYSLYSSLFTRKLVAVSIKNTNARIINTKKNRTRCRELTQCYKLAQVITQYARQFASAMNNIYSLFVFISVAVWRLIVFISEWFHASTHCSSLRQHGCSSPSYWLRRRRQLQSKGSNYDISLCFTRLFSLSFWSVKLMISF